MPTQTPAPLHCDAAGKALLARHAAWWERRGMLYAETPNASLGPLWLPLADGTLAQEDLDLTPEMLDLDRLAGEPLPPGPLEFCGDQIRTQAPYARVPWVEAILGCPIRATIQGGSMRSRAFVADWEDWRRRDRGRGRAWLECLLELTELLVARSGGRYAVVQTLMRGPSDLAEAVLGPELMCLSMYDHPRALTAFLEEVTEVFIETLRAQLARIPRLEGGTVNPFGLWAPGTTARTQCDASAFLSAQQYARWFLPYDVRIAEVFDFTVIHLHSGSLHTVEPLLTVARPQAIQVTVDPEPSAPPVEALVPRFRKILSGKALILDGPLSAAQVELLRQELPHDGLCILRRLGGW